MKEDPKKKVTLDSILKEVVSDKGGSKDKYLDLLNKIKYHESAGTMDPTIKQYGGGPGRGLYQFEGLGGSNRILDSAKRTRNYLKMKGLDTPEFIENIIQAGTGDASTLSAEQQDILAISDLRMKGGLNLKDYAEDKLTAEDVWADHWWIGNSKTRDKERPKKIQSFRNSVNRYKKKDSNEPLESETQSQDVDLFGSLNNQQNFNTVARDNTFTSNPVPKDLGLPVNNFQPGAITVPPPKPVLQDKTKVKPEGQEAIQSQADFIQQYMSQNKMKKGGYLNQFNEGGGLTEFNAGGSHGENPLGGIPQGMGANGKMNSVEQGETRKEDYVFSDQLVLDKETVDKHGLPKHFKGKTPADASKKLNDSFKETNSKIDKETTDEMLGRLTKASEELRVAQMLKENPEMLDQMMTQGQPNQMFLGGFTDSIIGQGFGKDATAQQKAGAMGAGMGAIGSVFDLGNTAFGKTGIDTSGNSEAPQVNQGAMIGSGALKGAQAGMALGPVGAGVGALVGGVAGLFGGNKAQKEANQANKNHDYAQNAQFRNTYAYGGNMNKYSGVDPTPFNSGWLTGIQLPSMTGNSNDLHGAQGNFINFPANSPSKPSLATPSFNGIDASLNDNNVYNGPLNADTFEQFQNTPAEKAKNLNTDKESRLNGVGDWLNDNGANMLRYAPALTNAYQLANMKKPEQERLDRLDNRYDRQLVDERALMNQASEAYNNSANALKGATNGSVGALRSNLLAAHLNRQKGVSGAFMQAEQANNQQNQVAQQFNLGVDQANVSQSNTEKDWNARNRAAYDNNKSRFISAIGQDVGNIGLEELRKKYPERMGLGYDWQGKYFAMLEEQKKKKQAERTA